MMIPTTPDGRIDRSGPEWSEPNELGLCVALADAHDALVMDAARYRWLRQFDTLAWGKKGQMFARAAALDDLDQVIDAGIFVRKLRDRHD